MVTIRRAVSPADVDAARRLFRAYAHSLDFDLDFQDFEREMAALPGPYAAPDGAILLATLDDADDDDADDDADDVATASGSPTALSDADGTGDADAVGVVAVKPLDDPGVCEMKRLYVAPSARGQGVGRALGEAVLEAARDRGYDVMRLDTVRSMVAARALYRSLGFETRSAYYANPLPDVVYMERAL